MTTAKARKPKRSRLPPEERQELILDAAIAVFTRKGFAGTPREIARDIGVSPALVYKYFVTKEDLIQKSYERAFLSIFQESWLDALGDRRKPLRDRLKQFYLGYGAAIDNEYWIRFAMYSALDGFGMMQDYLRTHVGKFIDLIAMELRHERGDLSPLPPTDREREQVWLMHSSLIFYLIRKYIHRSALVEIEELADMLVDTFLDGLSLDRAPAQDDRRQRNSA